MQHPYHKIKHHSPQDPFKMKLFNTFIIVFAALSPLTTLPQIYLIYSTKNAAGVSAITWMTYVISSCIWFSYGFVHKEKVVLVNSVIGFTFALLVFIGTLLYG